MVTRASFKVLDNDSLYLLSNAMSDLFLFHWTVKICCQFFCNGVQLSHVLHKFVCGYMYILCVHCTFFVILSSVGIWLFRFVCQFCLCLGFVYFVDNGTNQQVDSYRVVQLLVHPRSQLEIDIFLFFFFLILTKNFNQTIFEPLRYPKQNFFKKLNQHI